ncbi:trypco2 family protein [Streptomyces sp. NPDC006552]|uniref:trypco2 family protein n=1 Tax=Streptomyces sp. NPDC006552 TaxID=3157179 RepID=UPI00339FE610
MEQEPWVGLSDAVRGIREELDAALDDGTDERILFELGPIEMEFGVDVRKSRSASAGVKVYVLNASAGGDQATAATSRIKVTLNPVTQDGKAARIASKGGSTPPPPPAP